MQPTTYQEPLALIIIISSISIGIATIAALWILLDIILRRGWKSMMFIMIPVYVVNALYLWPITLWTYLKYGRPEKPLKDEASTSGHNKSEGVEDRNAGIEHQHHHHHSNGERPMFATVTIGVCHCGAGCVLGDIVGEWLVYGTGAEINGESLWVAFLVDFAFAIAFGIFFQYYSIAPMSGDFGMKTLYRAAKADVLSLLSFEIGLFAWMAIFQIAIFHWRLSITTVTYWWMMQIGMFIGHWTAVPTNWWLIRAGVKEPCA